MTNSSNSSTGGVILNPPVRQISPSKKWCFTFNNYTQEDVDEIVPKIDELCDMAIVGKEVGASGTPHLQGYVVFKKKCRPRNSFNQKIHWEKAKGNHRENHDYCSKEGKIIFVKGFPPKWACKPVKVLNDDKLRPWEIEVIGNIECEPDDRTIYWYWSKSGNMGKTTFTKYLVMRHHATILAGKGADVRNGVVEFVKRNGYTPHLVIYPIPRSFNQEYLSYESIENIKDMLFYSGKFEGGMVCGNCPHVIVFANEPPDVSRMSEDRWKVFELLDDHSCKRWKPKVLKEGKKWIEVDDD